MFYTFMGVNLVRKGGIEKAKFIPPGVMGAVPGMSSMATAMMKKKIEKAHIPTLPELMEMAQLEGVELIACKMTFDMMEMHEEDMIENISVWDARGIHEVRQGGQALPVYLKAAQVSKR